jgi:hypothetical protein
MPNELPFDRVQQWNQKRLDVTGPRRWDLPENLGSVKMWGGQKQKPFPVNRPSPRRVVGLPHDWSLLATSGDEAAEYDTRGAAAGSDYAPPAMIPPAVAFSRRSALGPMLGPALHGYQNHDTFQ